MSLYKLAGLFETLKKIGPIVFQLYIIRIWCHCRTQPIFFFFFFRVVLIAGSSPQKSLSARREQVPFSMAIGNGELMHECFPKHPRMGTAR